MSKIYYDMDGVLADFNREIDGLARFTSERGFFRNLEPLPMAHALNLELLNVNIARDTYILSSSPNAQADADKIAWLAVYVPNMDASHIIFTRTGLEKAQHAQAGDVLVDDFSDNLIAWVNAGGRGIKAVNGQNASGRKWNGERLSVL